MQILLNIFADLGPYIRIDPLGKENDINFFMALHAGAKNDAFDFEQAALQFNLYVPEQGVFGYFRTAVKGAGNANNTDVFNLAVNIIPKYRQVYSGVYFVFGGCAYILAAAFGTPLFEIIENPGDYVAISKKAGPLKAFTEIIRQLGEMAGAKPLDALFDELIRLTGYGFPKT